MSDNRHIPVLLAQVLEAFAPLRGTIVDGTLGGAGHASALLSQLPDLKVLGCDQDPAAIERARSSLTQPQAEGRLGLYQANFSTLVDEEAHFPKGFEPPWQGVLLDLGYSSNQLEDASYGMSFQVDAPLDMRLSRDGQTAWELMEEASAQELGDILKAYGEIIGAHRMAHRIKDAILSGDLKNSTLSLARLLEHGPGKGSKDKIHPATLVFQSLRIAVNDELRVLDHFLEGVLLKADKSARIAVITFHSLEDRLVKRWGTKNSSMLRPLSKKPIVAGPEEIKANPRSRSAKLRVYERL